jgi:adenylosuccinate synthase
MIAYNTGTGLGSIATMLLPQSFINFVDNLPTPVKEYTNQLEQTVGVPIAIIAGIVGLRLITK